MAPHRDSHKGNGASLVRGSRSRGGMRQNRGMPPRSRCRVGRMRTAYLSLAAAAAALLAAGCGSTARPPALGPVIPSPSAPGASAAGPGPFKVTMVKCTGRTAVAMAVNTGRKAASVQVQAAFLHGSTVDTTNTSGFTAVLLPGQRQQVSVDNVGGSGQPGRPSDTCELLGYGVMHGSTFAGTWPLAGQ